MNRSLAVLLVCWLAGCGPSVKLGNGDGGGTGTDPGGPCDPGARQCAGNELQSCHGGQFVTDETCANACDPVAGCVVCTPGTGTCNGGVSHYCLPDGSGYADTTCDPEQGLTCGPAGVCEGPCAPDRLQRSYVGCDYYPTVTGNPTVTTFHFAVAIANLSTNIGGAADVTIEGGALTAPITLTVQPGEVAVQTLPWQNALKMCASASALDCVSPQTKGVLAAGGAYHLRSTSPVVVYQFSPLEYTSGSIYSYTNDASLLLPTNAWGEQYVAASWPRQDGFPPTTWPGTVTVTASQDDTHVTLDTTANTVASMGAPACTAGTPQEVVLNKGDALEVAAVGTNGSAAKDDLTGSMIQSDKPVQVIAGAYCVFVPDPTVGYCDHIEESMFPIETLSTKYVITAPAVPPLPNGKEEVVRIIGTQNDTTLSYDPPQAGAPATVGAGKFVEIARTDADFVITASHKVLVAQYMEGQEAGGDTGDPAMAQAVPTDQYRKSYLFHAPTNYEVNYVNVTAPMNANVLLDGAPVTGFTQLGGSGLGVARVTLPNGANGNHTITGDVGFGISVYGYGQYTSYWYPGGLDLAPIPIP